MKHSRNCILIFFLAAMLSFFSVTAQRSLEEGASGIAVSVPVNLERHLKNKKFRRHRIDVFADSGMLSYRIANTARFPEVYRKIRFQFGGQGARETVIRRDSMKSRLANDLRINSVEWYGGDAEKSLAKKYKSEAERFSSGRTGGQMMKAQWHTLATAPVAEDDTDVNIKVKAGLFRRTSLTLDTLPTLPVRGYPSTDAFNCVVFDRFYHRKALAGWGFEKYRYEHFVLPHRKIVRSRFEIFFPKNSADASAGDLQPVIDYVRQNNLSILFARIEGSSSVEGDSAANAKLYMKRAARLVRVLQKYNNEPIAADTLLLAEGWTAFRESIRNTPAAWLDTLKDHQIRKLINSDPVLLASLEPYLRTARKATLSLTLSGRFSREELIEKVQNEFDRLTEGLNPFKTFGRPNLRLEGKLLGVIEYMDRMVENGNASHEDLARLVDNSPFPEQTRILLFYHLIKKQERPLVKGEDESWDSLFINHKWNNIFSVAHTNIIRLIGGAFSDEDRARRLKQAVDIQYYTIRYIEKGLLSPEVLCSMNYPMEKQFYGLILNHYAIFRKLSEEFSFSCYALASTVQRSFSKPEAFNEKKLEDYILQSNQGVTGEKFTRRQPKSFDRSEKGDQYFFLKTIFLTRDPSIRSFVVSSDNKAEFDLFYFLALNVQAWDPVLNHFYDSAVQVPQMQRLVSQLKRMDDLICTPDVQQLYLDFHLKSLIYAREHGAPGDADLIRTATESLKFISQYYKDRSGVMFPRLSLYIVDGLNGFHGIPTPKSASFYAFQFLRHLALRTQLTPAEEERLSVLERMYGRVRKPFEDKKEQQLLSAR